MGFTEPGETPVSEAWNVPVFGQYEPKFCFQSATRSTGVTASPRSVQYARCQSLPNPCWGPVSRLPATLKPALATSSPTESRTTLSAQCPLSRGTAGAAGVVSSLIG